MGENDQNTLLDDTPASDQDVTPSSSDGAAETEAGPATMLDAISESTSDSDEQHPNPENPGGEDSQAKSDAEDSGADLEDTSSTDADTSSEKDPETKKSDSGDAGDPGDELPDEPTPEELKHMNERTKRRIDKLLQQRREARAEAEKGRPIVEFMESNDIPMEDADVILGLAAQLRKGDFSGFLRAVDPYVQLARQYTGEDLPADLRQQVQQGVVSPAIAKELARRRGDEAVHRQRAQQEEARRKAQTEQEEANKRGKELRDAVTHWENSIRKEDPDYGAKADLVRRTVQALIQERGAPSTPGDAVDLVKEAYAETNRVVGSFRPAPKPTSGTPSSVHQTTRTPKPEPETMMDVVRQAAQGA